MAASKATKKGNFVGWPFLTAEEVNKGLQEELGNCMLENTGQHMTPRWNTRVKLGLVPLEGEDNSAGNAGADAVGRHRCL